MSLTDKKKRQNTNNLSKKIICPSCGGQVKGDMLHVTQDKFLIKIEKFSFLVWGNFI